MYAPFPRILTLAVVAVLCAPGCSAEAQAPHVAPHGPTDSSPHRAGTVTVDGVRIEYLDWGGSGPTLVFYPGMGNSAHVFDGFAPRFTDQYRVIGVSRVGFGGSDQPEREGYAIAARVEQLRAVLDTLRLQHVVLAGHSLGGDEITGFATTYPTRTAGVIYLDAALDHSAAFNAEERLFSALGSIMPSPLAVELASPTGLQDYLRRLRGVEYPIGEVIATFLFDSAGSLVGPRTPNRVAQAIFANTPALDYRGVRAPALALYSDWDPITVMFPFLAGDSLGIARTTAVVDSVLRPWVLRERERFAREVPQARVVASPSHHYQFLREPVDTERLMRAFLATLRPASR